MANQAPNLKVNVGADTSQFERGIRQARSDLKAFGSVSDDVLGKFGQAIGIDVKQVEQMASAIRGLGQKLGQAGEEGESAFGKIAKAATTAGASIAAIGIATAIAAFKSLTAEAENFKNTVAGANIELQTQAYIQTYRQFLHDTNSETGKAVAEWQANWQKGVARLGANIQHNFVSTMAGQGTFFQAAFPLMGTLFGGARNREGAREAAEGAAEVAKEIFVLERQRKEQSVEISKLNAEIADLMGVAKDTSLSVAERQSAIDQIEGKLLEKRQKTVGLENQLAVLYQQMSDYAEDSVEDADALLAQQQRVFDTDRAITQEENALLKIKNSLNNAANTQNAALQKQLELQRKIAQSRAELAALDLGVSGITTPGASTALGSTIAQEINTTAFQDQLYASLGDSLYLEVGLGIEKGSLMDLTNQINSVISGLAVSMSAAIGGLIGDLVTGGDAWSNFANAAISAFGDMATSVGKIAIECGVAALGIKAALESLGPAGAALAIGAGTALVALGAAVKAGLSSVASGNYSAGTSVASSAYGYGGQDYETRELTVNVTGTLQADGDQLTAVLNNTNNKKGYTT